MATKKQTYKRKKVKMRIRKTVNGTAVRPRFTVFRSNKEIYGQLIDDTIGKTIISASSLEKSFSKEGKKVDFSKEVGKLLAERAIAAGINTVVFDRNGYIYHGRVKAVADGARENGLKF